jgi:hypothetical protein
MALYNPHMGKLVKRAEFAVLGTIGIVFLSYTYMPSFLASLDDSTSTQETYTAAAYQAVAPNTTVTEAPPTASVTVTTSSTTPITAANTAEATSSLDATAPGAEITTEDGSAVDSNDSSSISQPTYSE